jgi:hypothetical protein
MNITINSNLKVKGHYVLQKFHPERGLVAEYEFDNLITDSGLNGWGTKNMCERCVIGTGTSVPQNTDTSLSGTSVVSTSKGQPFPYFPQAPNYYTQSGREFTFAQGTLNGNYSEIGVTALDGTLFSRSLILDNLGNPTTITILPIEQLKVLYVFTEISNNNVQTGNTIEIAGLGPIAYTIQPSEKQDVSTSSPKWNIWPEFVPGQNTAYIELTNGSNQTDILGTGWGSGGTVVSSQAPSSTATYTASSYVNNSRYRDYTYVAGINALNIASFNKIRFGARFGGFYAVDLVGLPSNLSKLNTQTLTLSMRYSWDRA